MNVTRTLGMLAAALACAVVAAAPAAATDRHVEIVGGSAAPPGAWPSIAYLRGGYHDNEERETEFACTGSVVAPQWIVTAAHCTFGFRRQPPERMVATLGVTDYDDGAAERIAVDRFVPDPNYDRDSLVGDIGLLHLARPTSRPPMPLATSAAVAAGQYTSPPGVPNAAGWGAVDLEGTKLTAQLQQAYLQIRTPAECSSLVSDFDPNTQTCAGTTGAAGACLGDSGGPLAEIDTATGQPALWGVTSYGPQTSEELGPCSLELPAVYTWIPAYTDFIQSTIAQPESISTPAASQPAPTAACRKARAAVTAAHRRERTARRRLHAARSHRTGAAGRRRTKLARHRYHVAQVRHRRAVRIAARRCRA